MSSRDPATWPAERDWRSIDPRAEFPEGTYQHFDSFGSSTWAYRMDAVNRPEPWIRPTEPTGPWTVTEVGSELVVGTTAAAQVFVLRSVWERLGRPRTCQLDSRGMLYISDEHGVAVAGMTRTGSYTDLDHDPDCDACGCEVCAPGSRCDDCACRTCYPEGADCGECRCEDCYPSGRDCGECDCHVCYPSGRGCDESDCQVCYGVPDDDDSDERDRRDIHDYGYKPRPQFQRLLGEKTNRFFGVEVECEPPGKHDAGVLSRLPATVYAKADGSLDDDGVEIVSHPGTLAWWQSRGAPWAKQMTDAGYRAWERPNCGLHVHVSRASLTDAAIVKLLLLFARAPDFVREIAHRKSSYATVEPHTAGTAVQKAKGCNGTRRSAINTCPDMTVEFRIFRSTLNETSLVKTITLLDVLCDWAHTATIADLQNRLLDSVLERAWARIWSAPEGLHRDIFWLVYAQLDRAVAAQKKGGV